MIGGVGTSKWPAAYGQYSSDVLRFVAGLFATQADRYTHSDLSSKLNLMEVYVDTINSTVCTTVQTTTVVGLCRGLDYICVSAVDINRVYLRCVGICGYEI